MIRSMLPVRFLTAVAMILLLAACDSANVTYDGVHTQTRTPQGRGPEVGDPNRETIFGSGGLTNLFNSERRDTGSGAGIGVNAFLWRASLDTLSFLSLNSADPAGGLIIYDWYTTAENPDERIKVTVFILGTRLSATAVRVAVNRQVKEDGDWLDTQVSEETGTALENAILDRARMLRIAWLGR